MGHVTYFFYRHYLSNPVNDMSNMQQPCFRGDGFLESFYNQLIIFNREIKTYLFIINTIPGSSLFPCIDHIRVVLFCSNHFIPSLKFQPINHCIKGFCRIPVHGNLFRIGSSKICQLLTQWLPTLVKYSPHIIRRSFI